MSEKINHHRKGVNFIELEGQSFPFFWSRAQKVKKLHLFHLCQCWFNLSPPIFFFWGIISPDLEMIFSWIFFVIMLRSSQNPDVFHVRMFSLCYRMGKGRTLGCFHTNIFSFVFYYLFSKHKIQPLIPEVFPFNHILSLLGVPCWKLWSK